MGEVFASERRCEAQHGMRHGTPIDIEAGLRAQSIPRMNEERPFSSFDLRSHNGTRLQATPRTRFAFFERKPDVDDEAWEPLAPADYDRARCP
jgi:hypothetical protein